MEKADFDGRLCGARAKFVLPIDPPESQSVAREVKLKEIRQPRQHRSQAEVEQVPRLLLALIPFRAAGGQIRAYFRPTRFWPRLDPLSSRPADQWCQAVAPSRHRLIRLPEVPKGGPAGAELGGFQISSGSNRQTRRLAWPRLDPLSSRPARTVVPNKGAKQWR